VNRVYGICLWYMFKVAAAPWWLPVNNSDWKHPTGPGSGIDDM